MANQPNWELVGNLGDVNVAEYGGFLVYRDTTGVYDPEVEMYEPNEGETGGTVYRFVLERPRFKTLTDKGKRVGYMSSRELPASERNDTWHWYPQWFVDKLSDVADTCDTTKFQLLRDLFSRDPMDRAFAYRDIIGHFGPHEFDTYPLALPEDEAKKRYSNLTVAR